MILKYFLCGKDNYGILLHEPQSKITISIDAPGFTEIEEQLLQNNWTLDAILLTHAHSDHLSAIYRLSQKYSFSIYASPLEDWPFPFPFKPLINNDSFFIENTQVIAIETPGHTKGSLSFYLPIEKFLFVGDTLFSLGCGKVEGAAYEVMLHSLKKIKSLDDDVTIFCGHDYSLINCRFALTLEPKNLLLQKKKKEIEEFQKRYQITPPSNLFFEKQTNPFLRWENINLRKKLYLEKASDLEVFTTLRRMKDFF